MRSILAAIAGVVALGVVSLHKRAYPGGRVAKRMTYLASLLRLRRIRGALISHIGTDSPAEKAGLEIGDVIIRFAGKKIKNSAELKKCVDASCGDDANVEVVRNGRKKSFVVTIAKPPSGGTPAGQSKPGD